MSSKPTIAVIGAGNLGGALASGLLAAELTDASSLWVADQSAARLEQLVAEVGSAQKTRPHTTTDNREAVSAAEIVVLAVKPPIVRPVVAEIADLLGEGRLLVSLAAAVPLRAIEGVIEARLKRPSPVIRAMPNIAMMAHAAATGLCANAEATAEHQAQALALFNAVGVAEFVEESQMHAVTALSGSGPAYALLLIEGLAAGGVKMGLTPAVASRLAAQTLLGAAKLALDSGRHPGALRDQVTTPGGTTIAGLHELELAGVRAALMSAVEAAAERSIELAELLADD